MIITKIRGGLGNQLFQYATGRCLAYKSDAILKLDLSLVDANIGENYRLGAFNIQENFATPEDLALVANAADENFDPAKNLLRIDTSNAPAAYVPEILTGMDNVYLHGYWQREEYFKDIADILRQEFTLKDSFGKVSDSWRKKILAADCAVSLHIRRGDYLFANHWNFNVLPMNYYFRCIGELKKILPSFTLFVFSDNLDWAKKNLNFGVPTEFVEGCERACEEMLLMSICKHNIIANSSFSWWGAWLNQNPEKKVFMPSTYNITAEGYTVIACDSKTTLLDFPPMMSCIIYADDENITTIAKTIQSVLSQNFQSIEIILLDANICDNGAAYRSFAAFDHMTIVKVKPAVGKYAAWNEGLKLAHGEYIMFLTGRDFIFSETANMVANIWESEFNRFFTRQHQTTNYEQFLSIAPHIFCTHQRIEENASGNVYVNEFADRKFVVKNDALFQGWNEPRMFQIDNNLKVALLINGQLNNLIGTKIFQRNFLLENNIRFDEKMNRGGVELIFLVNAFMRTEKIVLVPQIFYGRLN